MGFFSDLKEDLSQAVNELMPEETLDAAMTDGLETEQVLPEEEFVQETRWVSSSSSAGANRALR